MPAYKNHGADSRFKLKTKAWISVVILLMTLSGSTALAKKEKNPNIDSDQEKWINRGNSCARSGKADLATDAYKRALSSAQSVTDCLAVADGTEHYGNVLSDARRACLNMALNLAKTRDDYCQIALKAREFQLYEITKSAIDTLVDRAQTNDDLYDLARKAQSVALSDLAHLALEKAYTQTTTVPDALKYAKQTKLFGMEDLCRKTIRALIDDESDAHELLVLLHEIDPLQEEDLNRRLLKKALDCVKDVDQCKEVFDTARRYDEHDIVALASYRGRRMILLQQFKEDQEKYQQQLQVWRTGRINLEEQKAANDLMQQRMKEQKEQQGKAANDPGF
jgi:hypothetical protein